MKCIKFVAIMILLFVDAYSTEQMSDIVFAGNEKGMLIVEWSKHSPLEQYIDSTFCSSPFLGRSTANYRGFVATWRLEDSLLFLEKISIEQNDLPLTSMFGGKKGRIFANWYSGIVMAQFVDEKKRKGDCSIWKISLLKYERGRLVRHEDAIFNRIKNRFENSEGYLELSEQYDMEMKNELAAVLREERTQKDCSGKRSNQIEEITKINNDIDDQINKKKNIERKLQNSRVERIENSDSHLEDFKRMFSSERDPILGSVNGFPYSIHYSLNVKEPNLIGAVWLWMPVRDSLFVINYKEMIDYYKRIVSHASELDWLKEWKNESAGREVEAQIFGKSMGATDLEMELTALPAWKLAGLDGQPSYKFLLREKRVAVATIYMNDGEGRTLVTSLKNSVTIGTRSRLDTCSIFYHKSQKIPEFATISKSGVFEMNKKPANFR